MSTFNDRVRHAQAQIADILREDWNPIGVAPDVRVHDEYDCYVGEVYTLLTLDPSASQLAQYLTKLEAHSLGYSRTDPEALIPLAERLLAVDVPRRTLTLKSPARQVLQAIVTTFVAVILTLIAFGRPMRLTSVLIVFAACILAAIAIYHAVGQVLEHRRGGPAA